LVLSLFNGIRTGSGAHPASYSLGTGGALAVVIKQSMREADSSRPW